MAVGMSHSISCEDRPPEASRPADGEAANAMTWSVCSSITKDACKGGGMIKAGVETADRCYAGCRVLSL